MKASIKQWVKEALHYYRLKPKLPFGEPSHGYLHIGKAGGSSTTDMFLALNAAGEKTPMMFGHDWRCQDILRRHPDMKLAFVIRDPLERIISGFNSRLRQGRPRNNSPWTDSEAAAFSLFRSSDSFIQSCLSDQPFDISAVNYALGAISHLRRGYAYHFGSPDYIDDIADRIYCVRDITQLSDTREFLEGLLSPLSADVDKALAAYEVKHSASKGAGSTLSDMSAAQLEKLRQVLASEYEIYDRLLAISQAQHGKKP
jgi:hypothetical protein